MQYRRSVLINPGHERFDRSCDVFQIERPKLLKCQIEPIMHVVAHGSRDADATGRTFGLEPCGYIHHITVDIGSIWNYIADVNADAEPDRPVQRLIAITDGHLLLDFYRTSERH